ncbi:hypothetical protein [Streptococcus sp. 3764]|uniref:hypothetical protein n=1 Tax=Streptococcus sp. 3764 TaxID=2582672 RepID=UPI001F040FA7|nr:hypothetical protein [Streptococcus sp. 3764]
MKKILLSSVALLSLVATLPVNSPVSAQESISPKSYSHSNGSSVGGINTLTVLTLKTGGKRSMKPGTILIVKVG